MKIFGFSIRRNYNKEGICLRCPECGSKNLKEKVIATVCDYTAAEVESICANCGVTINYWAYGSFDPCFSFYDRSIPALFDRISCKIRGVSTP